MTHVLRLLVLIALVLTLLSACAKPQACGDRSVITPELIGTALAIHLAPQQAVNLLACSSEWCVKVKDAAVRELSRRGVEVESRLWKGEPLPQQRFVVIGDESFINAAATSADILLATAKNSAGVPVFRFSSGVPVADWREECVTQGWLAAHNIREAPSGALPGFTVR